ncbi:SDR family oxidoreductase [Prosthecomicrobium hirschii]|nr:SDR family oxidoreductase [Prosthecomicrobium hirschii]
MMHFPPPRNALITGAARRIGAAIAADLARHGWGVAIHCRTGREDAERLAASIRDDGGRAEVVCGDLADIQSVYRIVGDAADRLGPIDLLINNASMFEKDEIGTLDPDLFERQLRVNLIAPCLLADAFVARLPEGVGGHIVNLVDQRVLKPTPQFFSYMLSKSALHMATRTMAQALAPRVRVNAIGPGPTLANVRQSGDDFGRQAAAVPLGAGPDLAEFGQTIRYLVQTPSITGQMICLDGGQHLAWQTPDVVGIDE